MATESSPRRPAGVLRDAARALPASWAILAGPCLRLVPRRAAHQPRAILFAPPFNEIIRLHRRRCLPSKTGGEYFTPSLGSTKPSIGPTRFLIDSRPQLRTLDSLPALFALRRGPHHGRALPAVSPRGSHDARHCAWGTGCRSHCGEAASVADDVERIRSDPVESPHYHALLRGPPLPYNAGRVTPSQAPPTASRRAQCESFLPSCPSKR